MTKAERLLTLLTEVDDVLVEEAAQPFFPVSKKRNWGGWAALAACLLLVVGLVRIFPLFAGMGGSSADGAPMAPSAGAPQQSSALAESEAPIGNSSGVSGEGIDGAGSPPEVSEPAGSAGLPVLTFTGQFAEGAGGAGIWTNDVDNCISDGISPDTVGNTLPVYTTTLPLDELGTPTADDAAKEALLSNILSRFGLGSEDCTITNVGNLTAVTPSGTEISVNHDLVASIFLPTDTLPDTIRSADASSFETMSGLGQAVIQELGWLLDMDDPNLVVTGGDVNLYGEKQFYLTIYDGDPFDPTTPAAHVANISDDTLAIRLDGHTELNLIGNYPIITVDEATDQLLSGSWVGYNEKWYSIPTAEQILRAELVYCTDTSGLTMPYYRFYLDLGETVELFERNDQLPIGKTVPKVEFYYVPAVEGEYLSPSYSGLTFNS